MVASAGNLGCYTLLHSNPSQARGFPGNPKIPD